MRFLIYLMLAVLFLAYCGTFGFNAAAVAMGLS